MVLSPEILAIGAITGLIYALLAAGLVLVYRSTGVINFAYGELGALCAAVLAKLVDQGWPFWPSLVVVVALGAVLGGLIELVIVRRLSSSPRLVLLVATIGVGQLLSSPSCCCRSRRATPRSPRRSTARCCSATSC